MSCSENSFIGSHVKQSGIHTKLINFFNLLNFEATLEHKNRYYHAQYLAGEQIGGGEEEEEEDEDKQEGDTSQTQQASEVWNIGVMLYTLIMGDYPIKGESDEEIKTNISSLGMEWTPKWKPGLSQKALTFVEKLLSLSYLSRIDKTTFINDDFLRQDLEY
jgi:hypothetical protein